MRRAALMSITIATVLGPWPSAGAAPPVRAPEQRPAIASGTLAEACAWPTAVAVVGGGQCSGTLVHPRLVVYAAHCGSGSKTIVFGEDRSAPARSVSASCRAYPNYAGADDQAHDWAYCVLDEAVEDLPLAPPLYGCETELLEVGREVALVGFGQTIDDVGGLKRWASTTLVAVTPSTNTTLVGNPNLAGTPSICAGDSGGPALLQIEDGSWRTFGVASTLVGECGGYGAHSILSTAIGWIEFDSDIDITPCHTLDGSWAPTPACAGMSTQPPGLAGGSWADGCSGSATLDRSRSCGPAWDELDAKLPPTLAIVSPADGESFLSGILLDIVVDAVKHPDGYAIAFVELEVDGEPIATDANDPWAFVGTGLADGVHELVAIVEDHAGNRVRSEAITIGIGVEVPEGGDESSGSESETGPMLEGDSPCTCTSSGSSSSFWWLLLLLPWWRRLTRPAGECGRATRGPRRDP